MKKMKLFSTAMNRGIVNLSKVAGVLAKKTLTRFSRLHFEGHTRFAISFGRLTQLLFLFIFSLQFAYSQINWQQTNGPYGGDIRALTVSGTNIFAGTWGGGVFLSTDNGSSWNPINNGITDPFIEAMTMDGTNLFVGTGEGKIFLSTNNGSSWNSIAQVSPYKITAFAVSGTNLFIGSTGGVFLSTNNGSNWSSVNNGLTNADIRAISIFGTNLFAGTIDGVFLSTNNGSNWSSVNNGLTNVNIMSLIVNDTNIFVGTNGSGIFRSTDNGSNWSAVNSGLTGFKVIALTVNETNLFAGTYNGVFLSTDKGTTWSTANTGLTSNAVQVFTVSGSNLFAGTKGGVFLSINSGSSWNKSTTGITGNIHAFSANNTDLFAGTSGGVFLSTNNGSSWNDINSGLSDLDVISLTFNGMNLFAGTDNGYVFLSTNNGSNWIVVNTGHSLSAPVLALAASTNGNLFAGTYGSGVYLSTNNGSNWSAINTGLTNMAIRTLAVNGTNLFAGGGGGVFLSTDDGSTWSEMNNGLTDPYVYALIVSGTNLYAGTNNGSVFLSTDNGSSWNITNMGLQPSIVDAFATRANGNLFAGTYGSGVYLSTNNGSSWNEQNSGLADKFVQALITNGTNLFAGTLGGGVFNGTIPPTPPPTITTFTPTSSPIGTPVTITGTNFNATAANDIVYFGAVKAQVTVAASTSLSVTVPTGATYAPISVTDVATGLTAYSTKPFTVTFAGGGGILPNSFMAKVDFATGSAPQHIAIADLDGDGKPDMVTTNGVGNTISVFRNTGTGSGITSGSFATKVDFATNYGPGDVTIADLDGDGKPDLAVTNWMNTVSVFRNTSSIGSISFAAKQDFATGDGSLLVAIGDLDGDGKPDLAVSNYVSNTISVLRNTGSIGSISFADSVNFIEEGNPIGVAISDLDGDGKPELIITSSGNNILSIFRNTSVTGSITHSSFAARMDFVAGSGPADIVIGDLDGDGKPDLAVSTKGDNAISVFRNTSISGSIAFAAMVNFTTGSNPYVNDIGDLDGDGKPDLVVANHNDNTISVLRNTSTNGSITSSSFATKVDFATGSACHGVAICDLDGDGIPDVAVANYGDNTVSVLRNIIGIVPVELTIFSASTERSNTELRWKTATEVNNYGFEIERRRIQNVEGRIQNKEWENVAFVQGAGTSNSPHEYTYSDQKLSTGRYAYRLKQIDNDGMFKYSGSVEVEIKNIPTVYSLAQNYPNPFNPSTTIRFGLPARSMVKLEIFNILGQTVATLVDGEKEAGFIETTWQANAASGIYIYRLEAVSLENPNNHFVNVKKLLFLK